MSRTVRRILLGLIVVAVIVLIAQLPYWTLEFRYLFFGAPQVSYQAPKFFRDQTHTPDQLTIPDLGIDAPLIYVDQNSETVYQEALRRGVVHFPGTALPGQPGNAYFFGHSSDYVWSKGLYKNVFALLPKIQPGQHIVITDHDGNQFEYQVTRTFVVLPNDVSVLDQQGNAKTLLTLQTSYPIGTALKRFIVQAELLPGH